MDERLEDDDTSQPSVEEVEGVERDAEELDERVVAAGKDEQRNHVDDGQISGAVSDEGGDGLEGPGKVDGDDAKGDIGGKVGHEEDELEPRGKCPDVDGRAELELAVVALAQDGRVLEVLLEECPLLVANGKVPLRVVVEARHGPHISDQDGREPPDGEHHRDGAQDDEQVLRHHLIHPRRLGVLGRPAATARRSICCWPSHVESASMSGWEELELKKRETRLASSGSWRGDQKGGGGGFGPNSCYLMKKRAVASAAVW